MNNIAVIATIVVVAVIIYFIQRTLSRAVHRAGNALERKIRSGAASNEDELLHTVVTLKANATLSAVRQAVTASVDVKSSFWGGSAAILADTEKVIAWEFGSVAAGNGFKAQLDYTVADGVTTGEFCVTSHAMSAAVSPYIKKMTELRNQIITAFRSVDPNVEITTSQQEMTRTRRK